MEGNNSSIPPQNENNYSDTDPSSGTEVLLHSRTHRKKQFIVAAVGVLVVTVVLTVLYVFLFQKSSNNTTLNNAKSENTEEIATKKFDLIPLNTLINNSLKTRAVSTSQLMNGTGSIARDDASGKKRLTVYSAPRYQAEGYEFQNDPFNGYGNAVVAQTKIDADRAVGVVTNYLKTRKGMSQVEGSAVESSTGSSAVFKNKETLCKVQKTYTETEVTYVGIGCGDISSYIIAAKKIKPFHDAYVSAQNDEVKKALKTNVPYWSWPEIKNGKENYKSAELTMSDGKKSLFYKSPKENWVYFMSTASSINCSDLKTAILKNAFSKTKCLDVNGKLVNAPTALTAEYMVRLIQQKIKSVAVVTQPVGNAPIAKFAIPKYKLDAYAFLSYPSVIQSAQVYTSTTDSESTFNLIKELLVSKDMAIVAGSSVDNSVEKSASYANQDSVCSVKFNLNKSDQRYIYVGCANIASFEKVAKKIQPFHAAYFAAQVPATQQSLQENPPYYTQPIIQKGVKDYQRASITMGDAELKLFYKQPKGDWTFFMSGQSPIECSKFYDVGVDFAYQGYPCKNENGKTVKFKSPRTVLSVVNSLKKKFRGDLVAITKSDNISGKAASGEIMYNIPRYMLENLKYEVSPKQSSGFAMSTKLKDTQVADDAYALIVKYFKEWDMNKVAASSIDTSSEKYAVYANGDFVCSVKERYGVATSILYRAARVNSVGVGCANVSSYNEVAKAVAPFNDAYVAANPRSATASPLYFASEASVQNGKDGYKRATLNIAGDGVSKSTALFYQIPQKNWQFFVSTEDTPKCSIFDKPDLLKAFSGSICIGTLGYKKVL